MAAPDQNACFAQLAALCVRVNRLFLMQIGKDLLITSGGAQFTGGRVMEKNELGTFLEEAAALLSLFLLVTIIIIWAADYAIGPPY